ncbi:uncharacterized protein BDW47DRAFT_133146 [Aspergillus candidus]|uniref:Alpha/Beta hydrolase protein n=1 Tax=Aspergillus candidus TaxID=41067 RepID=A0A2I2FM09_ASPCN|nr:hypothetical protein BDW47DRAFT_133146 [Aspergillus candidus]PLB41677.1 hypothetical protein BDW47DRAFT_133146 [Aspergillus candidus]
MASYIANEKVHKNPFLLIPSDMDMNPVRLILEDLVSVLRLDKLLIYIMTLHSPCPSGPLDELYPNYPNLQDITLHAILVAFQSLLLLASVVFLFTFWFLPGIFPGGLVLIAWAVTVAILRLLNGQPSADCQVGVPENGISPVNDKSELWFFINGICTGRSWLQSNLTLLANTFHREIVGIHNPSKGLILDLLESLIQRDLDYKTRDIRQGRAQLRSALRASETRKVVLIAHSQGGIEVASILDWLYGELANETLRKLEIYTFGNAARHFRNPYLREDSDDPVIQHIEHYANKNDFVANIGVLQCTSPTARYAANDLFSGKVFQQDRSGHLLNIHYLDTMFGENHEFMDTKVQARGFLREEPGASLSWTSIMDLSRLAKYRNGKSPEGRVDVCCDVNGR